MIHDSVTWHEYPISSSKNFENGRFAKKFKDLQFKE